MKINNNATLKTSKEIEINAPVASVWKIHVDINNWKNWHPDITTASLNGRPEPGATFQWTAGGYKLNSTILEFVENKNIGWQGAGVGASAIHVWEFIILENENTLVRTKESMDGWLVKLFNGMMNKKLNESLEAWLVALKQRSESNNK